VTASARILQDDMTRATKAVAAAGLQRARIIMRLDKAEIEIIVGESGEQALKEEWTDDD